MQEAKRLVEESYKSAAQTIDALNAKLHEEAGARKMAEKRLSILEDRLDPHNFAQV